MADERLSFDSVLNLFHKRIFNLVYRLLSDVDEASDITQDVFVRAYKAYSAFDGSSEAVYPWLCKIAVNCCKNKFKQLGRRTRYEAVSLDDGSGESIASTAVTSDDLSDPAGIFERRELSAAIEHAVVDLQPEYRVVVVLRDMHGLSYREIVEVTGLTMDVVKTRLYRGREILRRRLSHYLMG